RARLGVRRWYSFLPMQARVARGLDGVVVPSESSRHEIVADMNVPLDLLHTVPLGVESDIFTPRPVDPAATSDGSEATAAAAAAAAGDTGSAAVTRPVPGRIVVVTSADVPLKGLMVLLEALAKLRAERSTHLVCIGKVREGGAAQRRVVELGLTEAVTFRSNVPQPEMVDLLRSAEVAVVPSLYEGFSLPAVEEMSCGLPLVATTAGALPEVAGPNGEAALLVPPGDPGALAGAIGTLLDDPDLRARMGAAGRRRVEERFSWKAAAAGTAAWYEREIAAVRAAVGVGPLAAPTPAEVGTPSERAC
ncbi:glycosyltransferase, partial [Frankia sp. EI5c]|uniref:glycosyltransferase n=1 Tax=Frankia sp. EI5c TaxID=683316 RepID=UPI001F5BB9E9